MLLKLLLAWGLMGLCVIVHVVGFTMAIRWASRRPFTANATFGSTTWILICFAGWTVLLHLVEIAFWAFAYTWKQAMPDLQTALYFSAVTYTTTGYGDLVLPKEWRLVGGVEALTGILMCGLSTGFFFAIVSKVFQARPGTKDD
jgi:hypothetical protein